MFDYTFTGQATVVPSGKPIITSDRHKQAIVDDYMKEIRVSRILDGR